MLYEVITECVGLQFLCRLVIGFGENDEVHDLRHPAVLPVLERLARPGDHSRRTPHVLEELGGGLFRGQRMQIGWIAVVPFV